MGVVLHGLEALPGQGRYAAAFRYPDGTTQTAVVHAEADTIVAAEASLPAGWSAGSPEYRALTDVVLALHRARAVAPPVAQLSDVDGGWDVSLGNVVLDAAGVPTCTAHGAMTANGDRYECPECGAAASWSS